jgi:hypothetical protein
MDSVFGNLRYNEHLSRYTLRSKADVDDSKRATCDDTQHRDNRRDQICPVPLSTTGTYPSACRIGGKRRPSSRQHLNHMYIEDQQWIGIFPTDTFRKSKDASEITGKWLCFGQTKELHLYKELLNTLVEEGTLRAVNIARKDPRFDPFPHKEGVICVYTSDDEDEKLNVKLRLTSIGLMPSIWKSEVQTRADWGPSGKLTQEAIIVQRKLQLGIQTDSPANSTANPNASIHQKTASDRHKVFISYSHADERWRKRISEQLGVLSRFGALDIWDDRRLSTGDDWYQSIHSEMSLAKVAILLVSATFLNSDFVTKEEVPKLFSRHAENGLRLIPILVRQCPWQAVPWLSQLHMRPSGDKPLAALSGPRADDELARLANEVAKLCRPVNSSEV